MVRLTIAPRGEPVLRKNPRQNAAVIRSDLGKFDACGSLAISLAQWLL
jgi:hypothetical protein